MPSHRALVVSLHDVSPHTFAPCARIAAELHGLGVTRLSLLVVPDHHHRGHFAADEAFCAWLKECADAGDEIVLHGYHHQRPRRAGETARQKLLTRVYTADEGEYFDLDRTAARAVTARGLAELRQRGFDSPGFIAPAWLLGAEAADALRDLGVEYTTRIGTVDDLRTRRVWASQSLVWSVRSAWRRVVSLGWNALLFRRQRANPLLRISVHPVDVVHAAIWKQIRSLVIRALADRQPMTYQAWIAAQRAAPPAIPNAHSA